MRILFKSDFFLRFAGGFAFGALALIGMQPGAVKANLGIGTPASATQVG